MSARDNPKLREIVERHLDMHSTTWEPVIYAVLDEVLGPFRVARDWDHRPSCYRYPAPECECVANLQDLEALCRELLK